MKKPLLYILITIIVLSMVGSLSLAGCKQEEASAEKEVAEESSAEEEATVEEEPSTESYEIEVLSREPEYNKSMEAIWKLYEDENPNIKITLSGWTEGQDAVYEARIAAGDPPHMIEYPSAYPTTKENYEHYVNLLDIDYPYWDKFELFDVKNTWGENFGVDNYLPVLQIWMPLDRTFIYHIEEMQETGLNPRETVKTMDDLKEFLIDLKAYSEKDEKLEYVLDIGWHPNGWSRCWFFAFTTALTDVESQYDVWTGKVRWDDMEKSPYVKSLNYFKELYDLGILPDSLWTRQWEPDYEAGFIAKNSILTWHGPWLWDKVLAADPSANLSGFVFPANSDGKTFHDSLMGDNGMSIYNAHQDKPIFDEVVKAFGWYNSPEIIKLRAEATGKSPALNMSEAGQPNLQNPQYTEVVKPMAEKEFGDFEWELRLWPDQIVAKYRVDGTPEVTKDDAMAAVWGDFFTGKLSTEGFLQILQERWERAYDLPQ